MSSSQSRVAPNPIWLVSLQKGKVLTQKGTQGKCHKGKDWGDASPSQGKLKDCQQTVRSWATSTKLTLSDTPQEKLTSADTLILYFEPPEQGQKTISFCFLSCLACRTFLQQLQESNMEMLPSSTWSKRVYHHVCIPASRKDKDRRWADLLPHFMSYPIGHKLITWSYLLQGTLGNEVFILGSHVPR